MNRFQIFKHSITIIWNDMPIVVRVKAKHRTRIYRFAGLKIKVVSPK